MGLEVFDYTAEGQMSFTDFLNDDKEGFKITKPIRLIELFAGIGAQAKALENIGADFEHYRVVEFDKYAISSYNAIHGTDFPPMDITKISGSDLGVTDTINYCYILTYSFPCQDLSVAGKQRGMDEGSGTRSSLLFEVGRLLDEVEELPQVLLMENVPNVHGKQNVDNFNKWLNRLEWMGYKNYVQDLNAKDYGVAQSRNRCFCVSILSNKGYQFPKPIPLEKRMKDYLEDEVDEKYYVTTDRAKDLIDKLVVGGKLLDRQTDRQTVGLSPSEILESVENEESCTEQMESQCANQQHSTKIHTKSVKLLGYIDKGTGKHQSNMVYSAAGLSPCLNAVDWKAPTKILSIERLRDGKD